MSKQSPTDAALGIVKQRLQALDPHKSVPKPSNVIIPGCVIYEREVPLRSVLPVLRKAFRDAEQGNVKRLSTPKFGITEAGPKFKALNNLPADTKVVIIVGEENELVEVLEKMHDALSRQVAAENKPPSR